jgi:hypothetical protein
MYIMVEGMGWGKQEIYFHYIVLYNLYVFIIIIQQTMMKNINYYLYVINKISKIKKIILFKLFY